MIKWIVKTYLNCFREELKKWEIFHVPFVEIPIAELNFLQGGIILLIVKL